MDWQGEQLVPTRIDCDPLGAVLGEGFAFPDTAVLRVPHPAQAPCVPITSERPAPATRVWAYGISWIRTNNRLEPFGTVLAVADPGGQGEFIRLQGGQVGPGMSGGPAAQGRPPPGCWSGA